MKQAEIKQIAILVADELERRQENVLNAVDLQKLFGVTSIDSIRRKMKEGVPIRKKKGVGYYAFESEIIKFLKM